MEAMVTICGDGPWVVCVAFDVFGKVGFLAHCLIVRDHFLPAAGPVGCEIKSSEPRSHGNSFLRTIENERLRRLRTVRSNDVDL